MKSNPPNSIEEHCNFVLYLEYKYNLLDFEIDGVKIWQYLRVELDYKLAQEVGLYEQPHTILSRKSKIQSLLRYLKNTLFDNIFTLKKAKTIIFADPRVVEIDGEYIDIYTKYLIDELEDKETILEIEYPYLGKHEKKRQKYTNYADWIILLSQINLFFEKVEITSSQYQRVQLIEDEINSFYHSNINLIDFFKPRIKRFKATYKVYQKVFKTVNPNRIFLTNSYGKAPLIKSAKDNNIEVIELQHGILGKYHMGYSFPNRDRELDYFPDKLYVWNSFWKELVSLPISDENIVVDTFRYYNYQKNIYSKVKRKENQVLVLSQGALGNAIAEAILRNYDRFSTHEIFYKLHPGEYDRWESYKALVELNKFENVKIVKNDYPLYYLFATSAIQIGVFSTAIYEGIEFGCHTILLNLTGIEYIQQLIELKDEIEIID